MNPYSYRASMLQTPAKDLPSQHPIDRLYQQFQGLKDRIRSSSNKRKLHPSHKEEVNRSGYHYQPLELDLKKRQKGSLRRDIKHKSSGLDLTSSIFIDKDNRLQEEFKKQQEGPTLDLKQLQSMLSNIGLEDFEAKCNRQLNNFQSKLSICQEMIRGVATLVKMKKTVNVAQTKPRKRSWFSLSPQKQRPVSQLINEYETKIELLTTKYEKKLREVERASSKKSQSESTAKNSYERQTNQFQSLLLARQNEVSLLKIQNSKLRRANDKLQLSYSSQLKLISSLEDQVNKLEEKQSAYNVVSSQTQTKEISSRAYEQTIIDLNKQIKQLEAMLDNKEKQNELNKSIIKEMSYCVSINEDSCEEEEQCLRNEVHHSFSELQNQAQICKSMILDPRKRKTYENLKKLEIEIDLITEENRHLEMKKHFLESQNQQIEQDEQRFQQQSNILKNQIRYLSTNLKILDEAAVALLKRESLRKEEIDELGNELKCKKLLLGCCEAVSHKTIK